MKLPDYDIDPYMDDQLTEEHLVRVAHEILSAQQLFDDFSDVQLLRQLLRQAYETVPVLHQG